MSEGLLTQFCEWVENAIDERGIYPAPAFWINRKGESTLAALALDGEGVLTEVWRQISCEQVTELVFGLDRSTRPGQGTEFADVLTCTHWVEDAAESWSASWRPFVIDYQFEPKIVRPPNFENEFWNERILSELRSYCPPFRMKLV